jgi:hypothetical protein
MEISDFIPLSATRYALRCVSQITSLHFQCLSASMQLVLWQAKTLCLNAIQVLFGVTCHNLISSRQRRLCDICVKIRQIDKQS